MSYKPKEGIPPSVREAAAALGRKGGRKKHPNKRQPPEHYARMVEIRRANKANRDAQLPQSPIEPSD